MNLRVRSVTAPSDMIATWADALLETGDIKAIQTFRRHEARWLTAGGCVGRCLEQVPSPSSNLVVKCGFAYPESR